MRTSLLCGSPPQQVAFAPQQDEFIVPLQYSDEKEESRK